MDNNWDNLKSPPWGAMPTTPKLSVPDVTAGSKGKIINSPNIVTRKSSPPNPMLQAER